MVLETEETCLRCGTEFDPETARVHVTIESSDIGFHKVEKTQLLCGACYTGYLEYVHGYE